MKKSTVFIFLLIAMVVAKAQDYLITFAGTGNATKVSMIKVENLTSGNSIVLNENDVLHLTSTVGIAVQNKSNKNFQIYPNPMAEQSILTFIAPESGITTIGIIDFNGKIIQQINTMLSSGEQRFRVSGINRGVYLVRVAGKNFTCSAKLLSEFNLKGEPKIEKVSSVKNTSVNPLKSTDVTVDMPYIAGDRLLYKGISGQYSTIVTDVPTGSKMITFDFATCSDVDENHYATVKIGTQLWMAENLRTTKLNDGTEIPNVTNDAEWLGLTTMGYCWYNNNSPAYKDTYGGLYNWYAVNTGKLCPAGWHVPSDNEYRALSDYLGSNSGGKIKETGTSHWFNPNTGASNETGFTCLPGGERYNDFRLMGYWAFLWSNINASDSHAGVGLIYYNSDMMDGDEYKKQCGFSVRCLKD